MNPFENIIRILSLKVGKYIALFVLLSIPAVCIFLMMSVKKDHQVHMTAIQIDALVTRIIIETGKFQHEMEKFIGNAERLDDFAQRLEKVEEQELLEFSRSLGVHVLVADKPRGAVKLAVIRSTAPMVSAMSTKLADALSVSIAARRNYFEGEKSLAWTDPYVGTFILSGKTFGWVGVRSQSLSQKGKLVIAIKEVPSWVPKNDNYHIVDASTGTLVGLSNIKNVKFKNFISMSPVDVKVTDAPLAAAIQRGQDVPYFIEKTGEEQWQITWPAPTLGLFYVQEFTLPESKLDERGMYVAFLGIKFLIGWFLLTR